jgi:nucleoside-diphosphate-sugar epimerase
MLFEVRAKKIKKSVFLFNVNPLFDYSFACHLTVSNNPTQYFKITYKNCIKIRTKNDSHKKKRSVMHYLYLLIIIFVMVPSHAFTKKIEHFYRDTNVLVTGGAGFIGSHLVEKLVQLNANVTILDDLSSGNLDHLQSYIDKIQFIHGSVTDFDICLSVAKNKKIIFHLAAFISVPDSMKNPLLCHHTNDIGTLNMLEAARINKVERFVFSSSCAVYGEKEDICSETDECHPGSPYGISKYIGEQYCKEYNNLFDVKTVILRYFNVFGDRQNPEGAYAAVVAKFNYCMQHNLPVFIFGDGKQTRDFISVKEVVQANIILGAYAEHETIQGTIFNIATGKSIAIIDLFESLKKNYPDYNQKPIFKPEREGDIKQVKANVEKYNSLKKQIS